MYKSSREQQRVFVGLVEISGYYGRIARHLRDSDYPISFYEMSSHPFVYNSEGSTSDYPHQRLVQVSPAEPWSFVSALRRRIVGLHFFVWAIRNHDVFVFVCGKSFNRFNLDLILLRLLRKRVVSSIWHGSEARPGYMDGAIWSLAKQGADPIKYIYRYTRRQHRNIRKLQFFSSDVIAHPLNSQFLTRPAINAASIGISPPSLPQQVRTRMSPEYPLRIVHIPSDRVVKGSDQIRQMLERVQLDFPGLVGYEEIHGVTNQAVLEILSNSDLLIDQLYSDTIWSGVGVEAAAMSLPTVVGNVNFLELKKFVDTENLPPAFVASPENLESLFRDVIQDLKSIKTMGERARNFSDERWNFNCVSERFVQVVTGNYKEGFTFDPLAVCHILGGGISMQDLQIIWSEGFRRFGKRFFSLRHRPDLMALIYQQLSLGEEPFEFAQ